MNINEIIIDLNKIIQIDYLPLRDDLRRENRKKKRSKMLEEMKKKYNLK